MYQMLHTVHLTDPTPYIKMYIIMYVNVEATLCTISSSWLLMSPAQRGV